MRRMSTERPARSELIAAIVKAGSLKETAAVLGVSRMTLYRWCRDLKIDVRRGVVVEEAA
jgi:DNA invertase Pin-like site-specific DNA recombinase